MARALVLENAQGPFALLSLDLCVLPEDVAHAIRQRIVERAGINRPVTAKALRHSYATHLMDQGVNLAVIASLVH